MEDILKGSYNKKSRPVSRILYSPTGITRNKEPLSFIWDLCCQRPLAAYPPATDEQSLTAGIHGIAPHRVYLISLQLYLYILSVALVLPRVSGVVGVTHYAALWCPDFPLFPKERAIRRPACCKFNPKRSDLYHFFRNNRSIFEQELWIKSRCFPPGLLLSFYICGIKFFNGTFCSIGAKIPPSDL